MRIDGIIIEEGVKRKILEKHNVRAVDIKDVFLGDPLFLRSRDGRYVAIGRSDGRMLAVVFEYGNGTAYVVTAYASSEWQKKLYKKKKVK